MRKVIYFILLVAVWLPLALFLFYRYSESGKRAMTNMKNLKCIEVGISKKALVDCMGEPDERYLTEDPEHQPDSVYFYSTPIWLSLGIEVHLNKQGVVYLVNTESYFDF